MVGVFGGIDYGFNIDSEATNNFTSIELSLDDIVNCAEAMLINSFKPALNDKFVNNLLRKQLKTVKYFRDKGYGGMSIELNFKNTGVKFYSSAVLPKDFHMFQYDLNSKDDNAQIFPF